MLEEITEESYEESHRQQNSNYQQNKSPQPQSENQEIVFPISFLMSGNDLYIHKNLKCKHPIIGEIFEIDKKNMGRNSESMYYEYVYTFVIDPYDCMVLLDENGIDYEKISSFQLFIFLFNRYMQQLDAYIRQCKEYGVPDNALLQLIEHNLYFESFKFFFGVDSFTIVSNDNNKIILVDKEGNFLLDEEMYENIHSFIKAINGIEIPKDRIYPENDEVKKMLIQDMKDEREQKERMKKLGIPSDDEDDGKGVLGKYLSSLTWGGNGGVTPFNRNQLHIYDVVDGFKRTNKRVDFDNIMAGIYSGCVNSKTIDLKELHWTN